MAEDDSPPTPPPPDVAPAAGATVENRVYLFESLARAYLEKSGDELSAKSPERRRRAFKALADLAYVSCVVADSEDDSARVVRRRILGVASFADSRAEARSGPAREAKDADDEA